jgi:hypothetical protein
MSGSKPGQLLLAIRRAFVVTLLLTSLSAATPPEVVRLRVPKDRMSRWFPPGTELKGMEADPFEALVRAARIGAERRELAGAPRLATARHQARWQDGVLLGRSELVISTPRSRAVELALAPWTPAIDPSAEGSATLRVDDHGQVFVRVNPPETPGAPAVVHLAWQLHGPPSSSGHKFAIGLPRVEPSSLELDLPEGLEPNGPPGLRQGPSPAKDPKRTLWQFDGPLGACDLLLASGAEKKGAVDPARLWVEGSTQIAVRESFTSWTLDWSVTGGSQAERKLVAVVDAGVEVTGVTGTGVDGVQIQPIGDGTTRLRIGLTGDRSSAPAREPSAPRSATKIRVSGLARVPLEGRWLIPSARPVNAFWTGGTTSVQIAPGRRVTDIRLLAGRITSERSRQSSPEGAQFLFDAERPGPVAELVLRKPRADVWAEVYGQLLVNSGSPRMICRTLWRAQGDRPQSVEMDLPRAWVVERVDIEGADEPAAWHTDALPGGGVRVHVASPSGDWTARPLILILSATSNAGSGPGPLPVPRIRPVDARASDEVWIARTEEGLTLRPTRARGLVWIDPAVADATPRATGPWEPRTSSGEASIAALAWRWTSDDVEALVVRERTDAAPSATVELVETVLSRRLQVHARVVFGAQNSPPRTLALRLSEPIAEPTAWRVYDESRGEEVAWRMADAEPRAGKVVAARGPVLILDLWGRQRGPIELSIACEGAWKGKGRIPLLFAPGEYRTQGTLLVLTGRNVRSDVSASGLRALDAHITAELITRESRSSTPFGSTPAPSAYRPAHAFAYDEAGGHLELTTEDLMPEAGGGVIRDALLTTVFNPNPRGAVRQRLALRVATDRSTSIDVTLPPGCTLERVLREGQPATPSRWGNVLTIPLRASGSSPSRSIVALGLEYTAAAQSGELTALRPLRPKFSLPCLSLTWEVLVPEPWQVATWGDALTPADPGASPRGLLDRMAGGRFAWRSLWSRWGNRDSESASAAMLRELDGRVAAIQADEISLGDWFTRWDAGGWPIVIDRLALAAAGWGPRSKVVPPRGDASRPGYARSALLSLGLALAPVGRVVLITTSEALGPGASSPTTVHPQSRTAWESALAVAAAWGSDASDRFQSVSHWREEAPRRSSSATAAESIDVAIRGERRTVWRFVAPGWPESGAELRLVDRRRQAIWGWTVACAILTLGLAGVRRLRAPLRAAGVVSLVGTSLLASIMAPVEEAGLITGMIGGAVGLAFIELGRTLPGFIRSLARGAPIDGSQRRSAGRGSSLATRALLGMFAIASVTRGTIAQDDASSPSPAPIIALFPFDGPESIGRKPERVVLRLEDYSRLSALAEATEAGSTPRLRAAAVQHRLAPADRGDVELESILSLVAEGDGVATWSFPLGNARAIKATLDGKDTPVHIDESAQRASVRVEAGKENEDKSVSAPRIELRLRRRITPRRGDWGESLSFPINACPFARVVVERHSAGLVPELPGAHGVLETTGAHGAIAGLLGSTDRLEVRWRPAGASDAVARSGAVEALYLWDALPAGDRVRARLIYHDPQGTSVVRVGLGKGVLVRESAIPGTVDVSCEGSADQPTWVARVSPPLPDGATVHLDLWRPRDDVPTSKAGGEEVRRFPRVEPLQAERFSGSLAFRRPPDWQGRITPGGATDIIGEEAFVRAWGNLPADLLTLSGAVKFPASFARFPAPEVVTGPPAARFRVQPTVHVALEPGRIVMTAEADLTETGSPVHAVEVECPEALHLIQVEADGLTDWTRPSAGRLRLRFDGTSLRKRRARLKGWLAVQADPLAPTATNAESNVPWPRWVGQDVDAGLLSVASRTRFRLANTSGVPMVPLEPAGPAASTPDALFHGSYRVARSEDIGRLRWDLEPPAVSVKIQSQVTVYPDSADWIAVLRYDVGGGPLDTINLRLPTDWARLATVRLDGMAHQQVAETRGETTYWAIRPERPIWGSQRLVVRASNRFPQGAPLKFPDLSPLGRGAVDTYIRLGSATRPAPIVEGAEGLRQVSYDSIAVDDALTSAPSRSVSTTLYQVTKPGWALSLRRPADSESEATMGDQPVVEAAELACTLAADGKVLGVAGYEVDTHSRAFLSLTLDADSRPIWASVNGVPSPPLSAGRGRWLISLAGAPARTRVHVVWRSEPPSLAPAGDEARVTKRSISLPLAGSRPVSSVVTLSAPDGVVALNQTGGLTPTTPDGVALRKAETLEQETIESIGELDRTSRRDGENLVAALVRIGLLIRQAERAAGGDPGATPAQQKTRLARVQPVAARLRSRLDGVLRNEALEGFAEAARVHLGLEARSPSDTDPTPESTTPGQIRPVGKPFAFQGEIGGVSTPPQLVWSATPTLQTGERDLLVGLTALTFAAALASAFIARQTSLVRWLGPLTLAAGILLACWLAGPVWLFFGPSLALLGRFANA